MAVFTRHNNWEQKEPEQGSGPDTPNNIATGVGAAVMTALMILRRFLPAWPVHPAGYLIAPQADFIITSIFIAWAIKAVVMRLGGVRVYRQLMPLFLGFIVGDALMFLVFGISGLYAVSNGVQPFRMYTLE